MSNDSCLLMQAHLVGDYPGQPDPAVRRLKSTVFTFNKYEWSYQKSPCAATAWRLDRASSLLTGR